MQILKSILITSLLTATSQAAVVILSSNFNSVAVTEGTPDADVTAWDTVNGIATPSTALEFTSNLRGDDNSRINVNQKVSGSSSNPWTTYIDLQVSAGSTIDLTDLALDWTALNSGGSLQTQTRTNIWRVELYNRSGASVGSQVGSSITLSDDWTTADGDAGSSVSIDISSLGTLAAGAEFRLILGTDVSGSPGHFVAFDNLSISGDITAIPEPSAALLGLAATVLILRRRR